ncbi:MAG: queuosine precursor transporter [Thermosphaera sp.]
MRVCGILLGVYVSSLLIANLIAGVKLVNIFGFVLPVAFLPYSITFPITDVVAELFGFKASKEFVKVGFISNLFALLLISVGYLMPSLTPEMQELYTTAFMPMFRVVLASLTAFIISQYLDVYVFWLLREKTKGRHLWLRNNVGELVAQFIDTLIFITLAFYDVVSISVLINMIFSQYIWKLVVAISDTPFVYLTLHIIRNLSRWEVVDQVSSS